MRGNECLEPSGEGFLIASVGFLSGLLLREEGMFAWG